MDSYFQHSKDSNLRDEMMSAADLGGFDDLGLECCENLADFKVNEQIYQCNESEVGDTTHLFTKSRIDNSADHSIH